MNSNERKMLFGILNKIYSDEVDKEIVYKIIDSGELKYLQDNDLLFEEGSVSDSMFILVSGLLLVFKKYGKELKQVGIIKQGEAIGEMGLISNEVRSTSIYSKRPSTLFKISKEKFDYLIRDNWHIMYGLMQQIISRFQNTLKSKMRNSAHFFSVVPINKEREGNECNTICRYLKNSLNNFGSTYFLSRDMVNELLGIQDINIEFEKLDSSENYPPLDELIFNLENDYDYIIIQTDSKKTSWTEWCLQMSDKILLSLDAKSGINNLEIVELVNFIHDNAPKHLSIERHLLIFHKSNNKPHHTKLFLDEIQPIKNYYHLEKFNKKDFDRVIRIITGNSIGLALGGGGARGTAHIGVYKAFIENNIPIDIVCGTSAGGIIAGGIANRYSPDDLMDHFKKINDLKMFKEYTLPFSSLIKTDKVLLISKMFAGETQIEDLWLPMFACCVDISAAKLKILDEGPLWEAIWATGALPGLLLPVVRDGALLVDGGIANNLPGDILIDRYGGKLISVNVSPEKEMVPSFNKFPNQAKLLLKKIFLKKKFNKEYGSMNIPTLGDIMMRAVMASSAYKVKEVSKMSHIFLTPPIEKFGLLDFHAVDELVELGYEYTMKELEKNDLSEIL